MVTRPAVPPYSSMTIARWIWLRLHVPQQRVHRLALGDEGGGPHHRLDLFRRLAVPVLLGVLHQVLEVGDADHVVLVLADHGNPREATAQGQRERLPDGLAALDEDHVGAGDHDLAHDRLAQLEHRLHHRALARLDHPALLQQVHQAPQLLFGGLGAVPGAAARGERAADREQHPRQRAEHPHHRVEDAGGGRRQPPLVLPAQHPGSDPGHQVQHRGHHRHRDEEGPPARAQPVQQRGRHQDRRGCLTADLDQQQHAQVDRRVGQHGREPPGPAPFPAPGQLPAARAGDADEGDLGGDAQPGQQHEHQSGGNQPRHRITRIRPAPCAPGPPRCSARQAPSSRSCSPNIVACSSGSA